MAVCGLNVLTNAETQQFRISLANKLQNNAVIQQKAQCLCIPGLHALLTLQQARGAVWENPTVQLELGSC